MESWLHPPLECALESWPDSYAYFYCLCVLLRICVLDLSHATTISMKSLSSCSLVRKSLSGVFNLQRLTYPMRTETGILMLVSLADSLSCTVRSPIQYQYLYLANVSTLLK